MYSFPKALALGLLLPGEVFAAVRNFHWNLTYEPIPGTAKEAILINGKWPPESIEVNQHDKIVLTVVNDALKGVADGVTMHAHGFWQEDNNWQDGPLGVTQWQYPHGLRSPLIVRSAEEPAYYGYDAQSDYVMDVTDNWLQSMKDVDADFKTGRCCFDYEEYTLCGMEVPPDNALVHDDLSTVHTYQAQKSKYMRVRIINMSASSSFYVFADNEAVEMIVIESDGVPLKNTKDAIVKSLQVHPGQRYSVLVRSDKSFNIYSVVDPDQYSGNSCQQLFDFPSGADKNVGAGFRSGRAHGGDVHSRCLEIDGPAGSHADNGNAKRWGAAWGAQAHGKTHTPGNAQGAGRAQAPGKAHQAHRGGWGGFRGSGNGYFPKGKGKDSMYDERDGVDDKTPADKGQKTTDKGSKTEDTKDDKTQDKGDTTKDTDTTKDSETTNTTEASGWNYALMATAHFDLGDGKVPKPYFRPTTFCKDTSKPCYVRYTDDRRQSLINLPIHAADVRQQLDESWSTNGRLQPKNAEPRLLFDDNSIIIDVRLTARPGALRFGSMNDKDWEVPEVPLLLRQTKARFDCPKLNLVSSDEVDMAYGSNNTWYAKKGTKVFFIVGSETGPHPFHLHGHDFQALSPARVKAEQYANNGTVLHVGKPDPALAPVDRLNSTVVPLPTADDLRSGNITMLDNPSTYSIIAITANNPGAWFFHCHNDFHSDTGMAGTLIVDSPDDGKWNNHKAGQAVWDQCGFKMPNGGGFNEWKTTCCSDLNTCYPAANPLT
ncbi:uncharacterized protein PG986_012613 [Apiospora aurea]|uniref:Multicopper oxidase n=1 Tax=Apiospora aurea TaxID=335848 RepID=A0ABR1Q0I3_9PEZI